MKRRYTKPALRKLGLLRSLTRFSFYHRPRVVLSLASRPLRRERVLVQGVDDETMLLDLDGGTYFALNEVGARGVGTLRRERSVADIATILIDEYDAPDEVIERDVLDLLTELEAEQLVIAG